MYKMILVDDETLALKTFSKIIQSVSDGFELTKVFESPKEAIEYMKTEHVDVIISDISMPGMSGLDFLEYVEKEKKDTFFIILSAYKNYNYVKFALSHNATEYLSKPVNKNELRNLMTKIKAQLDERKSYVECNYTELKCQQRLIDYIVGNNVSTQDFQNTMKEINIDISCNQTPVAIIHTTIEKTSEVVSIYNYSSDRIHLALIQIFRMSNIPVLSINYSQTNMNLILFSETDDFENFKLNIEEQTKKCIRVCKQVLNINISVSVTSVFNSLNDAKSTISKIFNLSKTLTYNKTRNEHITAALNYININYKLDISLLDVANHVHITPFHLSKLFKKVTGSSFSNYIIDYRISKVKDLLLNSNMTISEIIEESGFRSETSFYRAFKKSTGMTPQEYRNTTGGTK